jgi:AraC-like DNA-binding protein
MPEVAALVFGREVEARLHEALEARAHLRVVLTCEALYETVSTGRVSAIVAELRDSNGTLTAETIRRLRHDYPTVPVLAYCVAAQPNAADLLAVAQAGVTGLILRGIDDTRAALQLALESAEDACVARLAFSNIAAFVKPQARPIVEYCLAHARHALTVHTVARALGMHRKTLGARLLASRLPSPQAVIGWCRLILAARLMEDAGRSLERIAIELNYPSSAALRNMLARYTGMKVAEVRGANAFARVLDAFSSAVGHCHPSPLPPGSPARKRPNRAWRS